MSVKLAVIKNCMRCPHHETQRTPRSGFAMDHLCTFNRTKDGKPRVIAGYVEWSHEEPKDGEFPSWCPLETRE